MTEELVTPDFHAWLQKWVWFLVTALCGASAAGIAALLRDHQKVTWGQIVRAALISGVVGTIFLAALWDSMAATRPGWLIAVVLCAGAGGGSLLDVLSQLVKKAVRGYGRNLKQ